MRTRKWVHLLMVGAAALSLALAGCGSDGSDGKDGADGTNGMSAYELAVANGFVGTEAEWLASLQGADGEDGAALHTDESCNVCHGEDKAAIDISINNLHPLVDPKIVIADVVVASGAGATDTVTFNAFEEDGTTAVTGLTLDDFRFYIADIVPADTPTANVPVGNWATAQPERWLYERSGTDRSGNPYPNGAFAENGGGSYTYTFAVDLALGGADAPEFDVTHVQRLLIRAGGTDMLEREAAIVEFVIPTDGADTGVLSQDETTFSRAIVMQEACTNCHGDPLQSAAHGSGYQTPQGCVVCHTPIGDAYGDTMQADGAWLAAVIHAIHSADADRTAWDWSEVTYPQNIKECSVCHFDAGQEGADNWKTNPSAQACGTCHVLPAGHESIANNLCTGCHASEGSGGLAPSVAGAHAVAYDYDNQAYNVTISLSEDANADGVYEVGETILVTTTVDIEDFDYTNDDTNFLREATLYVYGPRALAVPVLTPGSTTDPDYTDPDVTPPGTPPDQGRNMLATAAADDDLVLTDVDGFKYQLLEITEDMAAGTYMIQSKIDYSFIGDRANDGRHIGPRLYPLDGWHLVTFQVKTATEEAKVAGECTSCHEQRNFSTYAHRSYFGTDGCIACHDQSGNHADPIANRVHAVHAASTAGDLTNVPGEEPSRVWDEITFPRNLNSSCAACHNSGNDSHRSNPEGSWGFACIGCHADTDGAYPHMQQMGSPFPSH